MSEWEPATEAEAAMREALAASDQEQYFGILARSELVLPVSAEAVAGRAPMGWGTWTTGNRTHILAFTSTNTLRLCLNEPTGSYRPLSFQALADEWPNYEWWLAVNPGLPIESYLPSWFVSQLTRGDVRLPGRTMGARARMAQSDLAAALHGRVRASAPAAAGGSRAEPAAEGGRGEPGRGGLGPDDGGRGGFGSRVETVEAEVIDFPPTTGPHPDLPTASPRPGPSPVVDQDRWLPPRPGLGAMLADAGAGAFGGGNASFGGSPAFSGDASFDSGSASFTSGSASFATSNASSSGVNAPTEGGSPFFSGAATLGGNGSAPAAPSFGGAAGFFQGSRVDLTEATVVEPVAEPSTVRKAVRDVQDAEVVSTEDEWETAFAPANETEANLLIAAEESNTDAFLSTLLLARVIVPVPAGTPPLARPRDQDFPWQIDRLDGQRFISVFTSPERLSEHRSAVLASDLSSVSVRFVQLIGAWPSEEISFAINPGSPVGATLPGSQIVALAAWAKDVGLRDESPADVLVAPKKIESSPATGVAGAPANGAEIATFMQRTVPHSQVPFYLERGYDRVSGFVNRASEVAHLNSPKLLYRALGLSYTGSTFADDDAEVFVVRWVAHRSDLYRLPYGGQHEAGMRAMQGWVIERPPFRGNGFAPGDTDVVAEFKVDSVRLPHGAQMWKLDSTGTATLVATFDADTTRWTPPPFGYGGPAYGSGTYA